LFVFYLCVLAFCVLCCQKYYQLHSHCVLIYDKVNMQ
jgi:hypothetical protein